MPAKRLRHKTHRENVTAAESQARAEQQTLRRLKNLHRSITSLAGQLRRALRRTDAARIDTARQLLAGTAFMALPISEYEEIEGELTKVRQKHGELLAEIEDERRAGLRDARKV